MSLLSKKFLKQPVTIYTALLCIIFAISFFQVLDKKVNLGGDNASYYILASSISSGKGYLNLNSPGEPPTSVYPPGYPLLMSAIMVFSKSITAQKVLNGLFLLGSVLLLFFIVKDLTSNAFLSFVISVFPLVSFHVLKFATMMMSEMSYLFFSLLAVFFLLRLREHIPLWKDRNFYLMLLLLSFSFHIRTQGITIVAAVLLYFLLTRRWQYLLGTAAGFFLLALPWRIRNNLQGLDTSRYLDQIMVANHWRPEAGTLDLGGLIERFFSTLQMLVTKGIPDSIFNFVTVDYNSATTFGEWIIGLAVLSVMVYGFWKFTEYRYLFLGYLAAVLGIISIWSAPGGNRYLITLIPVMQLGFFYGLYQLLKAVYRYYKMKFKFQYVTPVLFLVIAVFMVPRLGVLKAMAERPYPGAYRNYFDIANQLNNRVGSDVIVACRKPNLFYLYGPTYAVRYKYSTDDKEVIRDMVESGVDYVVLAQLGYGSTKRYLYPAINKNRQLFQAAIHLENPDTYLLKFNRKQAAEMLELN